MGLARGGLISPFGYGSVTGCKTYAIKRIGYDTI